MLWVVDSNGRIIPSGHTAPVEQPGDVTYDPATGNVYRNVFDGGRLRWWFLYNVYQTCPQV